MKRKTGRRTLVRRSKFAAAVARAARRRAPQASQQPLRTPLLREISLATADPHAITPLVGVVLPSKAGAAKPEGFFRRHGRLLGALGAGLGAGLAGYLGNQYVASRRTLTDNVTPFPDATVRETGMVPYEGWAECEAPGTQLALRGGRGVCAVPGTQLAGSFAGAYDAHMDRRLNPSLLASGQVVKMT